MSRSWSTSSPSVTGQRRRHHLRLLRHTTTTTPPGRLHAFDNSSCHAHLPLPSRRSSYHAHPRLPSRRRRLHPTRLHRCCPCALPHQHRTTPRRHPMHHPAPRHLPPVSSHLLYTPRRQLSMSPPPAPSAYTPARTHSSTTTPQAAPPARAPPPATRTHTMVTHAQAGTFKPNPKYALTTTLPVSAVPQSVRVALRDPNWREAMQQEFDALQRNKTWTLVPRPPGVRVLSGK